MNKGKITPFWGCMIPAKYPQMEASIRKSLKRLEVPLVDIDRFTCCPDPIYFKARNKEQWLAVAARNLAVAEEAGVDVMTACSGCTSTLREAAFLLGEDEELKERINRRLARIGMRYEGTTRVRHIVEVLRDDVGIERIRETVTMPLEGIKVAIHYGCHLLKPSQIMHVDDADYPQILERLVEATGATPLGHRERLLCCGKGCLSEEIPLQMTRDIFASITIAGGDCMGLICPTCFSSFDLGQIMVARKFDEKYEIPVIYYCQLLGLAQGFTIEELGLNLHRVKVDNILARVS
jgi:heterodisulfide reductase subunit B